MTLLRSGPATDTGLVRSVNQDLAVETGTLFAVADGMAPHAVGHGEEGAGLHGEVLVDRADESGVGGWSGAQEGHVTYRPRTRCRRPAGDHPSRAWSVRRYARCSPMSRSSTPGPRPTWH